MTDNLKIIIKIFTGKPLRADELKSLIILSGPSSHRVFEFLVKRYDPSLDLSYYGSFSRKTFLNEGRGWGTLKPYRILENGKTRVFEKIFFNNSKNLASALYFAENQNSLLKDKAIQAPRLVETVKGKNLTILLYEFWDLEKIPFVDTYSALKTKTLELCRDFHPSIKSGSTDQGLSSPAGNRVYHPKRDLYVEEFEKIEAIAQSFPVYFQHLDLGEENVYRNDRVIDWDNSGHYNLGIDFGRLLLSHYILNPDKFLATYKIEVKDYHSKSETGISFKDFYPVVLFYFLILFHGHHATEDSVDRIGEMIEEFRRALG